MEIISSASANSTQVEPRMIPSAKDLSSDIERALLTLLRNVKRQENPNHSIYYPNETFNQKYPDLTHNGLCKLEKKLFEGCYKNDVWKFIRDGYREFKVIIDNTSNRIKIHQTALENLEYFFTLTDELMQEKGYCCGRWYTQLIRPAVCCGKKCIIPAYTVYYRYQQWTYCHKCLDNIEGEDVKLHEDLTIKKSDFAEFTYAERRKEKFVKCKYCQRKFHEICVLHYCFANPFFVCQQCEQQLNSPKIQSVRASMLPETECDKYISNFLLKNNVNINGAITIRLLSAMDRVVKVKSLILKYRPDASKYKFKHCTLFSFFNTGNGTDICFFAVFFQLYGTDCSLPNRNSAYISYIDSVNLLPSNNRTTIYRLILLGLFEYLKQCGFQKIYLWSCPPKQHEHYILNQKPSKMKMPTRERLSKWYAELLEMGLKMKVIFSYMGIKDYAIQENWNSTSSIPYLEGDLWIVRMEEAIETVEKEERKLKLKVLKNEPKHSEEFISFKKRTKIWELMMLQIKGFHKEYFVIDLTNPLTADQRQRHDQFSETIDHFWINDRHLFVDFFFEYMLEFSSARRAQYSTYIMLHRLLSEIKRCAICHQNVDCISGELICKTCHLSMYHDCMEFKYLQIRQLPASVQELQCAPSPTKETSSNASQNPAIETVDLCADENQNDTSLSDVPIEVMEVSSSDSLVLESDAHSTNFSYSTVSEAASIIHCEVLSSNTSDSGNYTSSVRRKRIRVPLAKHSRYNERNRNNKIFRMPWRKTWESTMSTRKRFKVPTVISCVSISDSE